jgi:pimeloyl-ACP methyl ester carboxylesterase
MPYLRRLFPLFLWLASVLVLAVPVQAETTGIVLMHGFGAGPNKDIAGLGDTLTKAGYLVERPEMCWSLKRAYDRAYNDCLADVDNAIAKLKSNGAASIVVAGFSMGGVAALAYGATHDGLKGIIALAPAHFPDYFSKHPEVAESIVKAQAMIKSGHGDDKAPFTEFGTGWMTLKVTPRVYLSFDGPDSPGLGPANAAHLRAPLLWVAGTSDPSQKDGPDFAFAKAPANPLNKYVKVSADHLGTPDASREAVLTWLKDLH